MIRKLIPFPLLTLSLYIMWLLLTGFSTGHLFLGLIVAVLIARTMLTIKPERPNFRIGRPLLQLFGLAAFDVIGSNISVAKFILAPPKNHRSAFVEIPLELRDAYGLASLSIIVAATPGTLWLQHDAEHNILLLHVLDAHDEELVVRTIKDRYERLLMEIFE